MNHYSNKIILLFLLSLFLTITQFSCTYFQTEPQLSYSKDKVKEIDHVVKTIYNNGQFSGIVLVSVKGDVVYKSAVGYANLKDSIPNTCDAKFRIASFTKPFTSMLILQLVEDGVIKLDGKLIEYLPEFTVTSGDKITIRQLLTHRAGITGHPRISNLIDIEQQYYTRRDFLELVMQYDLIYEPGKGREYSNFGYGLLALLIEKVTGKSYDEVMFEKICKPAGMTNTLSDITEMPIEKRAIGYTHDYFTGMEEASYLDMSFCLGAGQLLSTAEDLYLFDQALYTDKLLSEKSKDLFFNVCGWRKTKYNFGSGSKRITCNNLEGSMNGFQSHTQRIEKDTVLIVVLRNIKEAVYENEIAVKWANAIASPILSILYNEDYELTKISGAFTIFKTLIESDLKQAKSKFNEIEKQQDKYYIDKSEFQFFYEELKKKNMNIKADEFQNFIRKI
ncbi:MAG: beta-lactamase family protein [Bacteroidales bacterium]|nr:beta-lactamase family protein [Bacteroidales bacterium]